MAATPYLPEVVGRIAGDVRATLAGVYGPQPLGELVDEVFAVAETLTRALEEKLPAAKRRLPVCKPGCDSCCRLHAVFVTPPEALRIAAHLRVTKTNDELAALRRRLDELAPKIAEMTLEDRARERVACPLLDETGACGVHPARPLLCRGYNSYDRDACLRAFDAGLPSVKLDSSVNQSSAHQSAFAGLLLGGAADGRDAGPLELIDAVRTALADPDSESKWLRGERVFDVERSRISRERAPQWREFLERGIVE
jgi:Fe-S-cluster containining protein